jgi:hypothetical protein
MAMLSMLAELHGKKEVSQSSIVNQVRKAIITKSNGKKKRKIRLTMKTSHMRNLVKDIYGNRRCSMEDRRLLALVACMFYGIKRFDDVINWKVENLVDNENGSLSVIQSKSKTDQLGKGSIVNFPVARRGMIGPVEILRKYLLVIGRLRKGFMFSSMRASKLG